MCISSVASLNITIVCNAALLQISPESFLLLFTWYHFKDHHVEICCSLIPTNTLILSIIDTLRLSEIKVSTSFDVRLTDGYHPGSWAVDLKLTRTNGSSSSSVLLYSHVRALLFFRTSTLWWTTSFAAKTQTETSNNIYRGTAWSSWGNLSKDALSGCSFKRRTCHQGGFKRRTRRGRFFLYELRTTFWWPYVTFKLIQPFKKY